MNDYHFLEMRVDSWGRKKMTQGQLAKELDIDRNRIQQLEKSPKVVPKEEELRAYCEYFNTTSDYLLNIRRTKSLDENIAMISKITGLDDTAINTLKFLNKKKEYIDTLNFIMRDCDSICEFLSNLDLYFDNEYTTPVCLDNKTGKYVDCGYPTPNGNAVTFGKQVIDNKGNLGWKVKGVPTSILESHALHCIQQLLDNWKKGYKKGSD